MKKTLLTLAATVGVSAGAFAQGQINVETPSLAGFNTVSSNPSDNTYSDFVSGTVSLEIFSQTSANDASLASQATTINADAKSASSVGTAISLIESDFTQQTFGTTLTDETSANTFNVGTGSITDTGYYDVGTSTTLTTGAIGEYAIIATYVSGGITYEGAVVLNASGPTEMGGGSLAAYAMGVDWPNQNILLTQATASPEPATIALAGLGGLSMLFLRRRKA